MRAALTALTDELRRLRADGVRSIAVSDESLATLRRIVETRRPAGATGTVTPAADAARSTASPSTEPARAAAFGQDHRRGNDGPGKRAAPGLVDPDDRRGMQLFVTAARHDPPAMAESGVARQPDRDRARCPRDRCNGLRAIPRIDRRARRWTCQ